MRADGRSEEFIQEHLAKYREQQTTGRANSGGITGRMGALGRSVSVDGVVDSTKQVVKNQLPYAGAAVGGIVAGPAGIAAGYQGGKFLAGEIETNSDRRKQAAAGGGPGGGTSPEAALMNAKPTQQTAALGSVTAADEFLRTRLQGLQPRYGGSVTPGTVDAATIDRGANEALQAGAIQRLQAAADGTVASAAELQLQRQSGRDQSAQIGLAAAGNRGSVGGALYNAAANQTKIASDTSATAAFLRAKEQEDARMGLAGVTGQARGQDITLGTAQAGLAQDASKFNVSADLDAQKATIEATLRARGLDDAQIAAATEAWLNNMRTRGSIAGGVDNFALDQARIAYQAKLDKDRAKKGMLAESLKSSLELYDKFYGSGSGAGGSSGGGSYFID